MDVKGGLKYKKIQYISKMTRERYHLKKKSIHEYQEKAVGFKNNIKIMDCFFTITSEQIICWVLVILLLYVYHAAVTND